jgi:hypothetical protein
LSFGGSLGLLATTEIDFYRLAFFSFEIGVMSSEEIGVLISVDLGSSLD